MYLTNRDRDILKFLEKYKSITINQTAKIFFSSCKQAYYQARKRLKLLADNNYIKRYRKDMRSEVVYYLEKKLSFHDLKVLDVYAELVHLGAEISYFKREYIISTKDKEYRADAVIEFTYQEYFYPLLVEVDYTHFTSGKKLLDIYNSNFFQEKYKNLDENIFPTVLILRAFVPNSKYNYPFNVYYCDYNSINFNSFFSYC